MQIIPLNAQQRSAPSADNNRWYDDIITKPQIFSRAKQFKTFNTKRHIESVVICVCNLSKLSQG